MQISAEIIGITLAGGLLVAIIGVLVMKSKLKSIKEQKTAGLYVTTPLKLSASRDVFLYKRLTKTPRPQNNNGPGGRRPGGGGFGGRPGRGFGGPGGRGPRR